MARNPAHRRTSIRAQTVTDLLTCGVPLAKIGSVLNIDEKTLRRRYSDLISAAGLRRGQKGFEATPIQSAVVERLSAIGTAQAEIAQFIGVSRTTLAIHMSRELKAGALRANLAVGANLFKMATGPADRQTTVTAAIWWSKARMDWKDTSRIETTGPDGGPVQTEGQVIIVSANGRGELPASPG